MRCNSKKAFGIKPDLSRFIISVSCLLLSERWGLFSFLSSHVGVQAQEAEERDPPSHKKFTSLFIDHPTAMNSLSGDVLHLLRYWRYAAHTLNLVAKVDVDMGCTDASYRKMDRVVHRKLLEPAESIDSSSRNYKAQVGRYFLVLNVTRWNSLCEAIRFIDETQKNKLEAVFDALATPCLQKEEHKLIAEYCQVCYGSLTFGRPLNAFNVIL